MTNPLVSFQIAKLAFKHGFDEPCDFIVWQIDGKDFYDSGDDYIREPFTLDECYNAIDQSDVKVGYYLAPRWIQLENWLSKKYDISIRIRFNGDVYIWESFNLIGGGYYSSTENIFIVEKECYNHCFITIFNKMKNIKRLIHMMVNHVTPDNITELKLNEIFVFGSNQAGIHGLGAALLAKQKFGAEEGRGHGRTGQCYALPTKDHKIKTLSIYRIELFVDMLYIHCKECEKQNLDFKFLITKIGCGLAGYKIEDIAPLFEQFLELNNVTLPIEFYHYYASKYGIET